jgi:hypothetical protein
VQLFCVCVVLCVGRDLVTGWSPVQGDLQTMYRIKKLKKRQRSNTRAIESLILIIMLVFRISLCSVPRSNVLSRLLIDVTGSITSSAVTEISLVLSGDDAPSLWYMTWCLTCNRKYLRKATLQNLSPVCKGPSGLVFAALASTHTSWTALFCLIWEMWCSTEVPLGLLSSGMWPLVAWYIGTYFSDESAASIFGESGQHFQPRLRK